MQQSRPAQTNPHAKLLVLDVDDTLIPGDTIGDAHRPLLFPEATKKLIEFAKSYPNVKILIASRVSTENEIRTSLATLTSINHPNIQIAGKETVKSNPDEKFGVVDQIVRENNIDPKNVTWVDDDMGQVATAITKGYTPVLVPCIEVAMGSKLNHPSSAYLDCLPSLVFNPTNAHEVLLGELGDVTPANRYQYATAQKLTTLYDDLKLELLAVPRSDISNQLEDFRKQFKNPDNFRAILRTRAQFIVGKIESANTFDELHNAYKLVLLDKETLRNEEGINKKLGAKGNTKRWVTVITALQEKALVIAGSEMNRITTREELNAFEVKHILYKNMLAQESTRSIFGGSSKNRDAYDEMYKELEKRIAKTEKPSPAH